MASAMSDTSNDTRRAIEAVLMVAEIPVEPQLLAQLLEIPVARVVELCEALAVEYDSTERGFALVQVAVNRNQEGRENPDDGEDDQQLKEGKSGRPFCSRGHRLRSGPVTGKRCAHWLVREAA